MRGGPTAHMVETATMRFPMRPSTRVPFWASRNARFMGCETFSVCVEIYDDVPTASSDPVNRRPLCRRDTLILTGLLQTMVTFRGRPNGTNKSFTSLARNLAVETSSLLRLYQGEL